jgi:transposase
VPRNRGRNTTLVSSLTLAGIGPSLTIEGGVDVEVFAVYAEQALAPALRAGDVVILDNLAAHLGARARAAIEARGAHLLLLPPYSPDLMPIELAFGTLKEALRRAGARTREALEEAIAQALRAITPADARAWFAHCGYPLPTQPLRPP